MYDWLSSSVSINKERAKSLNKGQREGSSEQRKAQPCLASLYKSKQEKERGHCSTDYQAEQ